MSKLEICAQIESYNLQYTVLYKAPGTVRVANLNSLKAFCQLVMHKCLQMVNQTLKLAILDCVINSRM